MVLPHTRLHLAAEYLLDIYSSVRFLLEAGERTVKKGAVDLHGRSLDYCGDFSVPSFGTDSVRDSEFHRGGYDGTDISVRDSSKGSGMGRAGGKRRTFFPDQKRELGVPGL